MMGGSHPKVKENEIRRAYKQFKLEIPRSKRKYAIPYSEFRRRYLERLLREADLNGSSKTARD